MNILTRATNFVRSPGDPKVVQIGPSAVPVADQTAKTLGWFSMALGFTELLAAPAMARMFGVQGKENLIRAFGAREVAAGMTSLSTDKTVGLWSRFGGDILDLAALWAVYRSDNPKRHNVGLALAAVAAIAVIDLAAAKTSAATHERGGRPRDYSDRSGFPGGLSAARGSRAGKSA